MNANACVILATGSTKQCACVGARTSVHSRTVHVTSLLGMHTD